MPAIFFILWTVLGLCVGSFCNVLIFRIPQGEEFVKTPSHCMTCGHILHWYELFPLVSWLAQGGKCRACKAPISRQYPIVEALNACFWLLAMWRCGSDLLGGLLLSLPAALPSAVLFASLGLMFGTLFNEKAAPGLCSIIISLGSFLGSVWFDAEATGGVLLELTQRM